MSTTCVQMCIIRSKLTVISEFCISFSRSRLYLLYNWEDRLPNTILVSGTDLEYRLSLPYPTVLIGGPSYYFCYDHTSAERNNDMLCRFVMIYGYIFHNYNRPRHKLFRNYWHNNFALDLSL